jgi:hypothetical protein
VPSHGKVPLDGFVMMKCKCGLCPVQAKSACAQPKIKRVIKMRASMKGSEMADGSMSFTQEQMEQMQQMGSKPEELPGPYCSTGVSACKDLDMSKGCICHTCEVHKKYSLASAKPVEHFCFNGWAS